MSNDEYTLLLDGALFDVCDIRSVCDESNQDFDTQLCWLREYAPEDHLMDRLKDEGITHVLGGNEDDGSVAVPIGEADLDLLRNAELLMPVTNVHIGENAPEFLRDILTDFAAETGANLTDKGVKH